MAEQVVGNHHQQALPLKGRHNILIVLMSEGMAGGGHPSPVEDQTHPLHPLPSFVGLEEAIVWRLLGIPHCTARIYCLQVRDTGSCSTAWKPLHTVTLNSIDNDRVLNVVLSCLQAQSPLMFVCLSESTELKPISEYHDYRHEHTTENWQNFRTEFQSWDTAVNSKQLLTGSRGRNWFWTVPERKLVQNWDWTMQREDQPHVTNSLI